MIVSQVRVALRKESVDRNVSTTQTRMSTGWVALRKESVDRNVRFSASLIPALVALRKESVDRNSCWLLA